MKLPRLLAPALIAVALLATESTVFARPPDEPKRERNQRDRDDRQASQERARPRISMDQAVAMAEGRFGARVVRAETRGNGVRVVYVLRLLNDAGRVWTVRVDAASGEIT